MNINIREVVTPPYIYHIPTLSPPRSIHTAHIISSGTNMVGQDDYVPHMALGGLPPLRPISGISTASGAGRPNHSDPQTLTAEDGASSGKGNPKGGAHHQHTGPPIDTISPREEEGHCNRIVIGPAEARAHPPMSRTDRARTPKYLGRHRPPEEG